MRKLSIGLSAALLLLATACSGQKNTPPSSKNNSPSVPATSGLTTGSKGAVLADLNGQPVTEEEVMEVIKPRLARIEAQIYALKRDGIDQVIEDRLIAAEAKKRNLSPEALVQTEVDDKVGEVTDREAEDFYNANKARAGGKTFEQVKTQIVSMIKGRKTSVYRKNFIDRLMAKADIQVYLERPRVEVAAGPSPSKGPEGAPVTLIEFTDYQCPFCGKARPALNEITAAYKNDLRYVVRNFPLDFHANAKKAAVAALCADEQKKYWEYSKMLWEHQNALDVPSLKKYAADAKLDTAQFDQCLDTDKTLKQVNQDQQDGLKAGVTGTPAFFINGQMLSGAQPADAFKKIIDEELSQAKRKKS